MSESDKKNEIKSIDFFSFDEFAKSKGVSFEKGAISKKISVPYHLDHDLFIAFSLHYLEAIRAHKNIKFFSEKILEVILSCNTFEEAKEKAAIFKEITDNM